MSILKAWAPYFQNRVRASGRSFHLDGNVSQLAPEAGEMVRAQVGGDDGFTVAIRHGQPVTAHCSCQAFATGTYCDHIWAALLDAHNKGAAIADPASKDDSRTAVPKARKRSGAPKKEKAEPDWMWRLKVLASPPARSQTAAASASGGTKQIWYSINIELSQQHSGMVVELWQRHLLPSGWSRLKPFRIDADVLDQLEDPVDQEIAASLLGSQRFRLDDVDYVPSNERSVGRFRLRMAARRTLLRQMVASRRCIADEGHDKHVLLSWHEDEPWQLWMRANETAGGIEVELQLRRGQETIGIEQPTLVLGGPDGALIYDGHIAPFDDRGATRWVTHFRDELNTSGRAPRLKVESNDIDRFLDRLYRLTHLPEIELPPRVQRPITEMVPRVHLDLQQLHGHQAAMIARLSFDYGGCRVDAAAPGDFITLDDSADRRLVRRDKHFEQQTIRSLPQLGFRHDPTEPTDALLSPRRAFEALTEMADRGWQVTTDQALVRRTAKSEFAVTSNIDWFELRGAVHFETSHGQQVVELPQILAAAREGNHLIKLDDGSHGLLPAEWLQRHAILATIGVEKDDHLRFKNCQVALIDALLEEMELTQAEAPFVEVRRRLHEFERIEPVEESPTFSGELRAYQRDGLGWLKFLRWFDAGGILADDMGLGKTVQVLAMLETRRAERQDDNESSHHPTLIVVPSSVIYNWIDEAHRFAPNLRVLAYQGTDRKMLLERLDEHDVIVTSYGLMRRDIASLHQYEFDYIVLDEAQAIKNPSSQSAKAARLLQGKHRIALSGTPVENHLGDIWSIFEFLNPGMLGSANRFGKLVRKSMQDAHSTEAATLTARALRPFILRRTKKQVLSELPEKTEQTIVCEMDPQQRLLYDQLLEHYRRTLLNEIHTTQMGQSAFMVLEALVRLRMAACHPGLIDPQHRAQPGTKISVLLDQLTELIEEGHKALVFSQFTSFLALVKPHLDQAGIVYEYLDGKTRDRKTTVEHFQNDESCSVFLISLKAGGLGLNLTAADYVFILDPWWNPAVEAQAIDRAHRIGQTRHVFAYRLVCENSVEQRIIELQEKKKQLADAIVGGQHNLLKNLSRDDLEKLLS